MRLTREIGHSETGYRKVDSDVLFQITRFRLRSVWALPIFFYWYWKVKAKSKGTCGLLATTFVIEGLHTCYTLSLWRNIHAMLDFNGKVFTHVHVANASFRYIEHIDGVPQLWSAQFRLFAVSSNLNWAGVEILDPAHDVQCSEVTQSIAQDPREEGGYVC